VYLETGRLRNAGAITIVTGPTAAGATPTARSWKVRLKKNHICVKFDL